MKKVVIKLVKEMEKEKKIKVLFLIESGSRAWGWESEDSDYDVRGVFIQDYLKINNPLSQINKKHDRLDIELWDFKKFLSLMTNSNPSVWEWLSSEMVYLDNPIRLKLKKIFEENFSRYKLKKHYVSMARQNFEKYINGIGNKANLKKYVYVLRSVACVLWIEKHNSPPPKHYKKIINLLPLTEIKFFERIVKEKKKSESLEGNRNKEVENYIISFFNRKFEEDKKSFNLELINKIFKNQIE